MTTIKITNKDLTTKRNSPASPSSRVATATSGRKLKESVHKQVHEKVKVVEESHDEEPFEAILTAETFMMEMAAALLGDDETPCMEESLAADGDNSSNHLAAAGLPVSKVNVDGSSDQSCVQGHSVCEVHNIDRNTHCAAVMMPNSCVEVAVLCDHSWLVPFDVRSPHQQQDSAPSLMIAVRATVTDHGQWCMGTVAMDFQQSTVGVSMMAVMFMSHCPSMDHTLKEVAECTATGKFTQSNGSFSDNPFCAQQPAVCRQVMQATFTEHHDECPILAPVYQMTAIVGSSKYVRRNKVSADETSVMTSPQDRSCCNGRRQLYNVVFL